MPALWRRGPVSRRARQAPVVSVPILLARMVNTRGALRLMLYRLDYIETGTSGEVTEPVRDPIIGGDLLTRHMQTARSRALELSAEDGRAIQISRIGKGGIMRACLIVNPDGHTQRPRRAKAANPREDCKRDSGRACFCTACRAERKAARR